jgi:hypothetical protein
MSSPYAALATKLGDHVVSTLERIQEVQVDALTALSALVEDVAPNTDAAENVPNVRDVAEANLLLAERLLAAQKAYAFAVLDALSPLTSKVTETASPKPAGEKRTAKSS